MNLTNYHAKYFAHELTKRCPSDSVDELASAVAGARVDLNPHHVDAALFASNSPLSKGAFLTDEVARVCQSHNNLVQGMPLIFIFIAAALRLCRHALTSSDFRLSPSVFGGHIALKSFTTQLVENFMPKPETSADSDLEVNSLLDLLQSQDEQMRSLFAKAINLYVAPGADQMSENEKVVRLREAIEQMLT